MNPDLEGELDEDLRGDRLIPTLAVQIQLLRELKKLNQRLENLDKEEEG